VLFTLLAERYDGASRLLTEQPGVLEVGSDFKDAMTTAAGHRPLGARTVWIIELNVPSYRVEKAQQAKTMGNPLPKRPTKKTSRREFVIVAKGRT